MARWFHQELGRALRKWQEWLYYRRLGLDAAAKLRGCGRGGLQDAWDTWKQQVGDLELPWPAAEVALLKVAKFINTLQLEDGSVLPSDDARYATLPASLEAIWVWSVAARKLRAMLDSGAVPEKKAGWAAECRESCEHFVLNAECCWDWIVKQLHKMWNARDAAVTGMRGGGRYDGNRRSYDAALVLLATQAMEQSGITVNDDQWTRSRAQMMVQRHLGHPEELHIQDLAWLALLLLRGGTVAPDKLQEHIIKLTLFPAHPHIWWDEEKNGTIDPSVSGVSFWGLTAVLCCNACNNSVEAASSKGAAFEQSRQALASLALADAPMPSSLSPDVLADAATRFGDPYTSKDAQLHKPEPDSELQRWCFKLCGGMDPVRQSGNTNQTAKELNPFTTSNVHGARGELPRKYEDRRLNEASFNLGLNAGLAAMSKALCFGSDAWNRVTSQMVKNARDVYTHLDADLCNGEGHTGFVLLILMYPELGAQ